MTSHQSGSVLLTVHREMRTCVQYPGTLIQKLLKFIKMILATSLYFQSGPELLSNTCKGQNFAEWTKVADALPYYLNHKTVLVTYFSSWMAAQRQNTSFCPSSCRLFCRSVLRALSMKYLEYLLQQESASLNLT